MVFYRCIVLCIMIFRSCPVLNYAKHPTELIRNMKSSKLPVVISFISLLITLAILMDLTPYLRGGYGWRWPYALLPILPLLPLCLGIIVYLAGAWWLIRRTQRAFPVLLWALLGAVLIPVLALNAREGDAIAALFTRTTSLLGTGQHWAATHVDWTGGEWRSWTEVMERLGGHMTNVPPGAPLIFHEIETALPASLSLNLQRFLLPYQCQNFDLLSYTPGQWGSAVFGMLMPVWGALTVFPLYSVAKRISKTDARIAAVWWALVPAAASFSPSWSTLNPLLSITVLLLLMRGFERQRGYLWFFASGLLSGTGLFINLALIPLPLFMGLYTLFYYRTRGIKSALVTGVLYSVGLVIPWIIFEWAGGQGFFDLLRTSMQFHLALDRPYWFWVWMHLWDWVMWTGFALALLWLAGLWRWWRGGKIGEFPLLGTALLVCMLILTISGTARGETGRVWLFFSPFMVVAAVDGLSRITDSPRKSWPLVSAAQAVLLVVMVACLDVVTTNFTRPPAPPQTTVSQDVSATFGADAFQLTGWDAQYQNGAVDLHLRWQGLSQVTTPYWFTAILVAPDGQTLSFDPWQPGGDSRYPTTCWLPGQTIGDEIRLLLPNAPEQGNWWISLAVYGDTSAPEGRLTVTQPGQPSDTQIGLGPVRIH
jgi:hypothetical protein